MLGFVGIIRNDILSGNLFNSCSIQLNIGIRLDPILKEVECQGTLVPYNGGCSLMVERVVVVRKTRVQFPPFTLEKNGEDRFN